MSVETVQRKSAAEVERKSHNDPYAGLRGRLAMGADVWQRKEYTQPLTPELLKKPLSREDIDVLNNASYAERDAYWAKNRQPFEQKKSLWSYQVSNAFEAKKEYFTQDPQGKIDAAFLQNLGDKVGISLSTKASQNELQHSAQGIYDRYFGTDGESKIELFINDVKNIEPSNLEQHLSAIKWLGQIFGQQSSVIIEELLKARELTTPQELVTKSSADVGGEMRMNHFTDEEQQALKHLENGRSTIEKRQNEKIGDLNDYIFKNFQAHWKGKTPEFDQYYTNLAEKLSSEYNQKFSPQERAAYAPFVESMGGKKLLDTSLTPDIAKGFYTTYIDTKTGKPDVQKYIDDTLRVGRNGKETLTGEDYVRLFRDNQNPMTYFMRIFGSDPKIPQDLFNLIDDKAYRESGLAKQEPVLQFRSISDRNVSSQAAEAKSSEQQLVGPALWKNSDHDMPIQILKILEPGPDGKVYVAVKGSKTHIPLDEISFPGSSEEKELWKKKSDELIARDQAVQEQEQTGSQQVQETIKKNLGMVGEAKDTIIEKTADGVQSVKDVVVEQIVEPVVEKVQNIVSSKQAEETEASQRQVNAAVTTQPSDEEKVEQVREELKQVQEEQPELDQTPEENESIVEESSSAHRIYARRLRRYSQQKKKDVLEKVSQLADTLSEKTPIFHPVAEALHIVTDTTPEPHPSFVLSNAENIISDIKKHGVSRQSISYDTLSQEVFDAKLLADLMEKDGLASFIKVDVQKDKGKREHVLVFKEKNKTAEIMRRTVVGNINHIKGELKEFAAIFPRDLSSKQEEKSSLKDTLQDKLPRQARTIVHLAKTNFERVPGVATVKAILGQEKDVVTQHPTAVTGEMQQQIASSGEDDDAKIIDTSTLPPAPVKMRHEEDAFPTK